MLVDLLPPAKPASPGIERIEEADLITKQRYVVRAGLHDHGRPADGTICLEDPLRTTRLGVECLNMTARTASEQAPAKHGWSREGDHVFGKSVRPLYSQAADSLGSQSTHASRLESRI